MRYATVVSYNPVNRFGFLRDEQGHDVFVGGNVLDVAGIGDLVKGQRVMFDAVLDRRGRGWRVSRIEIAADVAFAA
jgi:cold shock CspA family protein